MRRLPRPRGARSRSNSPTATARATSCRRSMPGSASAACRRRPAPRSWRRFSTSSRATRAPGEGRKLTAKSSAGDVLLAHLREQVQVVQAHDLPVRLDAPDAVHKMRVATRRLRSALTTFKPLFGADVVRPLRDELKWLAGELGAARDAEVMRDRVRTAVEAQGAVAASDPVAAIADEELGQAYRSAHDRVLAELDGKRYHALLTALDRLVTAPPLTRKAASPAGKALPRLVERSYTDVREIVAEADAKPAGDEREELLHDARKGAKRSRYAAESVSAGLRQGRGRLRHGDGGRAGGAGGAPGLGPDPGAVAGPGPAHHQHRRGLPVRAPARAGGGGDSSPSGTSTTRGRPRGASPCTAGCADRCIAWVSEPPAAGEAGRCRAGKRTDGSRGHRSATALLEVR